MDKLGRVLYLGFYEPTHLANTYELVENKYACGELEFQIDEYFLAEREQFSIDVKLDGTSFQKAVWSRLSKIPFGQTLSYGEVAQKIGHRDAARAVGNAVAANPVVIIVPCHRVLPVSGRIGNYALRSLDAERGKEIKRYLLGHERREELFTSSRASA
ncbi:MAG: methylated-DNA--[protein]-cysteine S-methyltransferase [Spirochaetales bacterium]